ncbi:MAG: class I SAM-dependent methyltransferase [Leptolyngbya sp. SIO1E4]|nr:class I SAM-dependent methyltransferase [Leptolyngbya sp. SIO1E4]
MKLQQNCIDKCRLCGSAQIIIGPTSDAQPKLISNGSSIETSLTRVSCKVCTTHSKLEEIFIDYSSYQTPRSQDRANTAEPEFLGLFDELIEYLRPASVLDFGCGDGTLIKKLSNKHSKVSFVGYDISTRFNESTSHNLRFTNFLDDLSDSPKSDLAISVNCLEHISNPIQTVEQIFHLIKRNSFAAIVVPNASFPNCEFLFADHLLGFMPKSFEWIANHLNLTSLGCYRYAKQREFLLSILTTAKTDASLLENVQNFLESKYIKLTQSTLKESIFALSEQKYSLDRLIQYGQLLKTELGSQSFYVFGASQWAHILMTYVLTPVNLKPAGFLVTYSTHLEAFCEAPVLIPEQVDSGTPIVLGVSLSSQKKVTDVLLDKGLANIYQWPKIFPGNS